MRYWHLLLIAFLIPTCAKPANNHIASSIPTSAPLLVESDMSTPPEVSEEAMPTPSEYVIRTRVVIEYTIFTKDDDTLIVMYGVTPDEIYRDIEEAEKVFAELKLRFEIDEIVFQKYEMGISKFFIDALKYPDTMSVYYLLPHVFPYAGLSSAPWEIFPQGILLSAGRNELTLAHEVGHYFGLLHTFHSTGDFCDDTWPQINEACEDEADCLPNCGNIMNYCVHDANYVTYDQVDRMRRFLRAKRANHIKLNSDKKKADIEAMYNQILDIGVHNYKEPKVEQNDPPRIDTSTQPERENPH